MGIPPYTRPSVPTGHHVQLDTMKILIHARIRAVFEELRSRLEAQAHQVDGAFTGGEGIARMAGGAYDKVFIGIGVVLEERLQLMAEAAKLGTSMVEITDANTVARELFRNGPSGGYPCLPMELPEAT